MYSLPLSFIFSPWFLILFQYNQCMILLQYIFYFLSLIYFKYSKIKCFQTIFFFLPLIWSKVYTLRILVDWRNRPLYNIPSNCTSLREIVREEKLHSFCHSALVGIQGNAASAGEIGGNCGPRPLSKEPCSWLYITTSGSVLDFH